jgi:hypothetical protein
VGTTDTRRTIEVPAITDYTVITPPRRIATRRLAPVSQ